MTALADWLLAQIAADEAVARHCELGWTAPTDVIAHIGSSAVLVSPGRLLAQCVAHRKIVEEYARLDAGVEMTPSAASARASMRWVVGEIASIYRGRPGWQEDWA